jgi:hypothetical protein
MGHSYTSSLIVALLDRLCTRVFGSMSFFSAGSTASEQRQADDLSYIRYNGKNGKPTAEE